MFATQFSLKTKAGLPKLAATAVICLSLGANTHVSSANSIPASPRDPIQQLVPASPKTSDRTQILSLKDEALYRGIFVAQAQGDWKSADKAITRLTDKHLLGHVLADRYLRRPASLTELQSWLNAYADLPEAKALYDRARRLPLASKAKLTQPAFGDIWTGNDGYGSSFGFRIEASDEGLRRNPRFATKINAALRRGEPDTAATLLAAEQNRRDMSSDETATLRGQIAAGFFYEGQIEQARQMARQAITAQNPLALWIGGLSAWKQNDMAEAGQLFAKLATQSGLSMWDRTAADYWAYRALKRAGETAQANYWLRQAATQPRSFYGALATHLLGRDAAWAWALPEFDAKSFTLLSAHPVGNRALALLQIGQNGLAEDELRRLNPQGQRSLQDAMLALADKNHMTSLTLQLGGMATHDSGKPYDAALYPVPTWQPEQGFQMDRALLYALMRHESQFDPQAISDRGACGLMQLMPTTAHLVANDNNSADECSRHLLDPSYNMALGQKYVRHLANQPMIGDNLLFLLAAYNSGPNKVSHWVDDQTRRDPLLFVESLPVRETRDYLQHVMVHYWTYRARLDQPETSLAQLANGQWPRYSLRDDAEPPRTRIAAKAVFEVATNQ